jgi:hypothetical protein
LSKFKAEIWLMLAVNTNRSIYLSRCKDKGRAEYLPECKAVGMSEVELLEEYQHP